MEQTKLADFMSCDLRISDIVQIYRQTNSAWKRDVPAKRECEGLLLFVSGGIHYDFDGFSFDAHAGDALKLPAGIPYSGVKLGDDDNEYCVIDFTTEEAGEFLRYPLPLSFRPDNFEDILSRFSLLESTWNGKQPLSRIEARNMLYSLFGHITRSYMQSISGAHSSSRLLDICAYIKDNAASSSLTVSSVAERFFISETHLRRIFAENLKQSPSEYIMLTRIENARRLLLTDRSLSITEVADRCGYSSVYYFSAAFKKRVGMTCREFIEKIKENQ